jgi:hypothetical protein
MAQAILRAALKPQPIPGEHSRSNGRRASGRIPLIPTATPSFRHFSPKVPDSLHIGAYPCIFHFLQPFLEPQKSAVNKHVLATSRSLTSLDRTQEVGGSNPPSSIGGMAGTSAPSIYEAPSNRLRNRFSSRLGWPDLRVGSPRRSRSKSRELDGLDRRPPGAIRTAWGCAAAGRGAPGKETSGVRPIAVADASVGRKPLRRLLCRHLLEGSPEDASARLTGNEAKPLSRAEKRNGREGSCGGLMVFIGGFRSRMPFRFVPVDARYLRGWGAPCPAPESVSGQIIHSRASRIF